MDAQRLISIIFIISSLVTIKFLTPLAWTVNRFPNCKNRLIFDQKVNRKTDPALMHVNYHLSECINANDYLL